jgi:hypothetical protein
MYIEGVSAQQTTSWTTMGQGSKTTVDLTARADI